MPRAVCTHARAFLPLLYVLAQHDDGQAVELFNDEIVGGALSMTSVRVN